MAGTGKTATSAALAEKLGFEHVKVGELVESKSLHCGRDEEFDCWILDEDKVSSGDDSRCLWSLLRQIRCATSLKIK